jgi:hypothetical protein
MLLEKRMRKDIRENFYRLWQDGMQAAIRNAALKKYSVRSLERTFKNRTDYYQKDAENLLVTLKELDVRGDAGPEPLWELCVRFADDRPPLPQKYMETLYKLREWYPTYKQVANGEVQWRIVHVLCDDLKDFEWAADEADALIERYPGCRYVKRGDALWQAAVNRHAHADTLKRKEACPPWRKALKQFRLFQLEYRKHSYNRRRISATRSLPSLCNEHIGRLVRSLRLDR